MLRFVTKRELWDIEDSGALETLPRPSVWHLKTVQDAVAYNYLCPMRGKHIGEVGGGKSRLLPRLARNNRCVNFEVFEGRDGGPAEEVHIEGVENIKALVGQTEGVFPAERLDVLFSISVVEHLLDENVAAFFRDCRRLLKPGGTAMHLIDLYLHDQSCDDPDTTGRVGAYIRPFTEGQFSPCGDVLDLDRVSFSCSYATNPDNVMAMWNRQVPHLEELREQSQSVSLLWLGRR